MEKIQRELLGRLKISPFDSRLRRSREEALALFERVWGLAVKRGGLSREEDIASLYAHCLGQALNHHGVEIPDDALLRDERIPRLLREGLR